MNPTISILLLGVLAGALIALAGWLLVGARRSPQERERARRVFLATRGRVTEAEVVEIQGAHVAYSYEVGGVTYQTVQDVAPLRDLLPRDPQLLLGPAIIKYAPGNPANSILISEDWCGVRLAQAMHAGQNKSS
jgi:hypothetical protein